MHAIDERGESRQDDDGEADPVAGEESDGKEDQDQSAIGRVAHETEDAGLLQGLFGADGDVDTEGFAEGEDGDPADN